MTIDLELWHHVRHRWLSLELTIIMGDLWWPGFREGENSGQLFMRACSQGARFILIHSLCYHVSFLVVRWAAERTIGVLDAGAHTDVSRSSRYCNAYVRLRCHTHNRTKWTAPLWFLYSSSFFFTDCCYGLIVRQFLGFCYICSRSIPNARFLTHFCVTGGISYLQKATRCETTSN